MKLVNLVCSSKSVVVKFFFPFFILIATLLQYCYNTQITDYFYLQIEYISE